MAYVLCVYPRFSCHKLSRSEFPDDIKPVGSIPRQGGRFYWQHISADINKGATMHYVAMFHEVNEGSAIFKSINNPPVSNMAKFINVDSMLSDPHLWLNGEAGKMHRNEKLLSLTLLKR